MKRIISIVLILIVLVSAIGTLTLPAFADNGLEKSHASASSGDLLYEVKFGQSDGVYRSGYFRASIPDPTPVTPATISDGGRTLGLTHNIDSVLSFYCILFSVCSLCHFSLLKATCLLNFTILFFSCQQKSALVLPMRLYLYKLNFDSYNPIF